jgi:hypothetical protein
MEPLAYSLTDEGQQGRQAPSSIGLGDDSRVGGLKGRLKSEDKSRPHAIQRFAGQGLRKSLSVGRAGVGRSGMKSLPGCA